MKKIFYYALFAISLNLTWAGGLDQDKYKDQNEESEKRALFHGEIRSDLHNVWPCYLAESFAVVKQFVSRPEFIENPASFIKTDFLLPYVNGENKHNTSRFFDLFSFNLNENQLNKINVYCSFEANKSQSIVFFTIRSICGNNQISKGHLINLYKFDLSFEELGLAG